MHTANLHAFLADYVAEVKGAANAVRTRLIETFRKDIRRVSMSKLGEEIGVLDLHVHSSRSFKSK